jgi:hypothetical protein
MVQQLRWFTVLTVVGLVTQAAAAHSGHAADRAGQRMEPNKVQRGFLQEILDARVRAWKRAMERCRPPKNFFKWADEIGFDWETDDQARDADPPR